MLNTQEKRDVIYALEEYTKELESQGNIAKRNEVMELTWKVSSSLGKEQIKEYAMVFTATIKANDIEGAIEKARVNYGNEVADFAEFTIEGESE